MAVFNVTPVAKWGNSTWVDVVHLNQRAMSIRITNADTKETIIAKLLTAGRLKRSVDADEFILERQGDVVSLFTQDRADLRMLIAEMIKDGGTVPLTQRQRPDSDTDDYDFSDL